MALRPDFMVNRKAVQRHTLAPHASASVREMGLAGIVLSVKYEEVYLHDYATPREAQDGLTHYFEFNNHERPNEALDQRTPAEVYFSQN